MPAKTYQCLVCQAEVSKPQSFAYKNGRACRHHEEAQEQHTSSEEAKKKDLEKHKTKPRTFGYALNSHDPMNNLKQLGYKNPNEYCWCCNKDGVYEHLIFERCLINMSKIELKTEGTPIVLEFTENGFRPSQQVCEMVQKELGVDKVPLRRIEIKEDYPDYKLNQILNQKESRDKKQLVRMTGIIVMCKDCSSQYELPWQYVSDQLKTKSNLEHMMLIGGLGKSVVDSIAASEIAQEELSMIMNK